MALKLFNTKRNQNYKGRYKINYRNLLNFYYYIEAINPILINLTFNLANIFAFKYYQYNFKNIFYKANKILYNAKRANLKIT